MVLRAASHVDPPMYDGWMWTPGRAQGPLEVAEQHRGVAVQDEADGETDSQVRARYPRDPLEECSDPELWQRLHHGDGESSESEVSMTSTSQPHDP